MTREVWIETADWQSTFTMLLEGKRTLHQVANWTPIGTHLNATVVLGIVMFLELRFRVKGVHLTGTAIHEQKHTPRGARFKMWLAWRK